MSEEQSQEPVKDPNIEEFTPLFHAAMDRVALALDKRQSFRDEMTALGWYERVSNLYRIKGKLDGDFGAFKLNDEQSHFLLNRSGRDLILKSRQAGFTTLMCLYAYDRALWDGWVTGIMSHIKERTQKIFEIVGNAHDWFKRDWGKLYSLTEESSSANQLSFLENKGSVMVSYDFQSLTMKFLHVSEAAFIDNDRIENSLQSVPENGEVCLESTANGCGGFFYDQWQLFTKHELGAPYKGFFFPWFNHYPEDKERWLKVVENSKLNYTDKEEELINNYSVTPSSLCWRRWKIMESFKGDEDRFEGQYPSDDRTCFLTGENPVFPASVLKYQSAYVKPAALVGDFLVDDEGRISFKESSRGIWKVWEKPNVNSSYVFGVDCSEGIGKDAGVISGWNRKTGYQVIELTCQLVPEELASEAFKVLKYYNMAWVCPEINNHGLTFVTSLVNKGYSRIYKRTVLDELTRKNTQKLGWYNTNARKIDVTNSFLEKCRYGQINVRSETLLKQMTTFIQSSGKVGGTLKREARAGCHDDCFIRGTNILTNKGNIPIETIKVGDLVLTREGYRPVVATRSNFKKVITKYGLTGTPNHPFITTNGEKEFDKLSSDDTLYIWNEKQLCIEERSIIDIQNPQEDILEFIIGPIQNIKKHLSHYIERFGKIILDLFQKDMSSTIKITIHSITQSKIWNVSQNLSIIENMPLNLGRDLVLTSEISFANPLKRIVSIVEKNLLIPVKQGVTSVMIIAQGIIEMLKGKRRVYNLQVANNPEYFVNNILVHNCVIAACLAWEMDSSLGVSHDTNENWLNQMQENTSIDPETGFVVLCDDESPFHDM